MLDRLFRRDSSRVAYYIVTYALYTAIAGSFDVAFTLRVTGSFAALTGLYLLYYSSLTIAFVVSTLLASSGRFSRSFRGNLLFQAGIGFLMFFALPTKEQPLVLIPYFMMKGVSEGLFWSTRHASMTCLLQNDQRDRFLLSVQAGTIAVSVSMPFLAGLFMHFSSVRAGYSGVYVAAALAALIAFALGPRVVAEAPSRPDLRKFRRYVASRETRSWRTYIFASSINNALAIFAAGVLNVYVLKTEFNIGMFASGAAALSAVFILGVRRHIQGKSIRRVGFVAMGAAGDFAGRVVYVAFLSVPALLFKAVCDSFLSPLRSIFAENIVRRRSDLMAEHEGYSPLEPYLFQEIVILFARFVGFLASGLAFSLFAIGPFKAARFILLILSFAPFIDLYLIDRIERENLRKMTSHDNL